MAMHRVTKQIDFCYGHRLLNYDGKCRHLHGHNGLLEVDIESPSLDTRGMVVSFTDVKDIVKGWIDDNLDHKMLLNREDPVVPLLLQLEEPVYLMENNPTAENIARLIFDEICRKGLMLTEVRLWETPTSFVTYREG
jgi:6-pyruvoyltetrahydropterin/6-carboxytetrahydropterin synthase